MVCMHIMYVLCRDIFHVALGMNVVLCAYDIYVSCVCMRWVYALYVRCVCMYVCMLYALCTCVCYVCGLCKVSTYSCVYVMYVV